MLLLLRNNKPKDLNSGYIYLFGMGQDKEGKQSKRNSLGVINRASRAFLLTVAALSSSKPTTYERIEDEGILIPGIGWVPSELYKEGIKDLETGLASAINSIYLLSQNYDGHKVVSRSDVPLDIAMRVAWDDAKVGSIHADRGIYHRDNIWRTPEESRAFFAGLIKEALSQISEVQYKALNDGLRAVVDHGRDIVAKGSVDSRVVDYRPDTIARGIYRLPQ